jgi:hypothetical protein
MVTYPIDLTDEEAKDLEHVCAEMNMTAGDVLRQFVVPALESHRSQRVAAAQADIVAVVEADPEIKKAVEAKLKAKLAPAPEEPV